MDDGSGMFVCFKTARFSYPSSSRLIGWMMGDGSGMFVCFKTARFSYPSSSRLIGWMMGDGSWMLEYATELPGYHSQIQLDYLLKLEAKLMDE